MTEMNGFSDRPLTDIEHGPWLPPSVETMELCDIYSRESQEAYVMAAQTFDKITALNRATALNSPRGAVLLDHRLLYKTLVAAAIEANSVIWQHS